MPRVTLSCPFQVVKCLVRVADEGVSDGNSQEATQLRVWDEYDNKPFWFKLAVRTARLTAPCCELVSSINPENNGVTGDI